MRKGIFTSREKKVVGGKPGESHCEAGDRWAELSRCSHLCFSFPRVIDELYLPKFSISSDYNLEDTLPQLGMSEVFTLQADLSGVTGDRNLAVTQVSL